MAHLTIQNFPMNNVPCVAIWVTNTNSKSSRFLNSAQSDIQLTMGEDMIWQIYANKFQSLSLGLICGHCKIWSNRKLPFSQCKRQIFVRWRQSDPWNNHTLALTYTSSYFSLKNFHSKFQYNKPCTIPQTIARTHS